VPKLDPEVEQQCELQRQELARLHIQRRHAFTLIWPLVCRRLESRPNINASELFDELRAQYPGRFHCGQLNAFIHLAPAGDPTRSRRIGQRCFSVWTPIPIKPRWSS
jgi:hypothetical protein